MKDIPYTKNFKLWWQHWVKITKRYGGMPEAFKKWQQHKLENDLEFMMESVNRQKRYRDLKFKRDKWVEPWQQAKTYIHQFTYRNEYLEEDIEKVASDVKMNAINKQQREQKRKEDKIEEENYGYVKEATNEQLRRLWKMPQYRFLIKKVHPSFKIEDSF